MLTRDSLAHRSQYQVSLSPLGSLSVQDSSALPLQSLQGLGPSGCVQSMALVGGLFVDWPSDSKSAAWLLGST